MTIITTKYISVQGVIKKEAEGYYFKFFWCEHSLANLLNKVIMLWQVGANFLNFETNFDLSCTIVLGETQQGQYPSNSQNLVS